MFLAIGCSSVATGEEGALGGCWGGRVAGERVGWGGQQRGGGVGAIVGGVNSGGVFNI